MEWSDRQEGTRVFGGVHTYTIEGVFAGVPWFATSTKTITWQVRAVDTDNDRLGDLLEAVSPEQVDEVTYRSGFLEYLLDHSDVFLAGIIAGLVPVSLIALAKRLGRR